MIRSYKVRFNLSKGANYMKWKVEGPYGVSYYDPSKVSLVMSNCQLKNSKATAQKIYDGAHKTVCAWIRCNEVKISRTSNRCNGYKIYYNPRTAPYWTDKQGNDIDNSTWPVIMSGGKQLLIKKISYDTKENNGTRSTRRRNP